MLAKKGGTGFPYVVMMDGDGAVLTTFRPTTKDAVQAAAKSASTIVDLKAKVKADPKDADSHARLLMATLKLKASEEDRKTLGDLMAKGKVSSETRQAYKAFEAREKIMALVSEMNQAMRNVRDPAEREAKNNENRASAYKSFKDGLVPLEAGTEYLNYLITATYGAIDAKDKKTATTALGLVEESGKGIDSLKDLLQELQSKIAAL